MSWFFGLVSVAALVACAVGLFGVFRIRLYTWLLDHCPSWTPGWVNSAVVRHERYKELTRWATREEAERTVNELKSLTSWSGQHIGQLSGCKQLAKERLDADPNDHRRQMNFLECEIDVDEAIERCRFLEGLLRKAREELRKRIQEAGPQPGGAAEEQTSANTSHQMVGPAVNQASNGGNVSPPARGSPLSCDTVLTQIEGPPVEGMPQQAGNPAEGDGLRQRVAAVGSPR
ncbi:unnamed protein product [Vitrella brassicaformis CCMP3155]|uniref:Uncharacterized protein n=1 Tax=Vitrella brassicaformis (strain CCMP3155) TaxID=1169540 RepID=A0A0G4EHX9_VITBC|nr:unnamed protein product [Vitrella brassicaformis CCMP3155]|mmetsp:Transcript_50198/g.125832  ORF Transcript_50198/g.125832 Transcript_50198/m.125832 type:complete len:231 (-) Transcript_50198:359-1051(-)|eukprot:CEL95842.1 unnamed protein product [Vitrella brassicaformis CCMP3155]